MSDKDRAVAEDVAEVEAADTPKSISSEAAPDAEAAPTETEPGEKEPAADEAEEEPLNIHTLKPGQHLAGKVKSIASFGVFVDIGIAQDGLVHISQLAKRKVDKPGDVVSAGDEVEVWVKKVDTKRGRISLTMIKPVALRLKDIKEGAELEGTVTRLESYGAFVDIGSGRDGLVHISQITHDYIDHPKEELAVGDKIGVKVLKVNRKKRQIDLSIKALLPPPAAQAEAEAPVELPREMPVEEESPQDTPTAMALAYAAALEERKQDKEAEEKEQAGETKSKNRQKEELDAIIARTLATRDQ